MDRWKARRKDKGKRIEEERGNERGNAKGWREGDRGHDLEIVKILRGRLFVIDLPATTP